MKTDELETTLRQAIAEIERLHHLGETCLCETVLSTFPSVREHRDSVLELIYYEYVLSQDREQPISDLELQQRFPEFQVDLQKILNVDHVFRTPRDTESDLDAHRTFDDASYQDRRSSLENDNRSGLEHEEFGDYELLEILGRGGMGVVYQARQRKLNRFVAVKTIDTLSSLNPVAVARFRSEAELIAKLQHPNIVQVYEIGSQLGVPYFSMELVNGGTLAEAMSDRPLVPMIAARIIETLARAVHYAHSQSIVHRDLKPSNILLARSDREEAIEIPDDRSRASSSEKHGTPRFEPKIADFGLAKYVAGALDRSATQALLGTPSYMAPELIDPALIDPEIGTVGPACDIYSLGAILYDALVGRPPFSAATIIETIQQVRHADVISPLKLQSKIPRDLETICLKCLRKDPTKRYPTAKNLADDLQRFLNGQPILARPTGFVEHSWKWARRHPSLTALITSVMIALVCIGALWIRSEKSLAAESVALKRNDRLLYDRDVSLAQFEYLSNRIERSREILENTRTEYRNWEWDYLYNQTQGSVWESPKLSHPIVQADISPDGQFVAIAAGVWGQDDSPAVEVWDISTNELKWKLEGHPPSEACDARFSPDGALLLTAATTWKTPNTKGGTRLWNLSDGSLRAVVSESNAYAARFSPDGKSIYVGENEGWVKQFSVETGELVRIYVCANPGGMILDLDLNPDGSRLIVAARDQKITLWDTVSGTRLQTLTFNGDPRKLTWSPDGHTVSVSHYSGLRTILDFNADQLTTAEERKSPAIVYGEFTPDGSQFVSSSFGSSIELCDAQTGYLAYSLPAHNGHTKCIGFDASSRRMVTGGGDNRVRVWDLGNNRQQPTRSVTWGAVVNAISFHPSNGEMAISLQKHPNKKHAIEIRDVQTHKFQREFIGHSNWPTCIAYSTDGSQLISGSLDKTVRIWDTLTGKESTVFAEHQSTLAGVAFLPNSSLVASIDVKGGVIVWDATSNVIERSWQLSSSILSVSFHPRRPWIAVASKDHRVEIWDVFQEKPLQVIASTENANLVTFSPDGQRLAIASQTNITSIWPIDDLMDNEATSPLSELRGHSDVITSISFSSDGKRLVSLSQDESIRLFDVDLGYELFRLDSDKGTNGIVKFSADGKSIVRTLPGNFSTWSIASDVQLADQSAIQSTKAWHLSEAVTSARNGDQFAAAFHRGWLIQLDPEERSHFRHRSDASMLLGNFAAAEQDMLRCDQNKTDLEHRRLLGDLTRIYIHQEKWPEYDAICQRLDIAFRDSNDPAELNTLLWFCALGNNTSVNTSDAMKRLDSLMANPKLIKHEYLNTLALCEYRNRNYTRAIHLARESEKLLKGAPSPSDWLIISLSFARLSENRIGWLPKVIQDQIRSWNLSRYWLNAEKHMRLVDAWMDEKSDEHKTIMKRKKESSLVLTIELPHLRKEWEAISHSPKD